MKSQVNEKTPGLYSLMWPTVNEIGNYLLDTVSREGDDDSTKDKQ